MAAKISEQAHLLKLDGVNLDLRTTISGTYSDKNAHDNMFVMENGYARNNFEFLENLTRGLKNVEVETELGDDLDVVHRVSSFYFGDWARLNSDQEKRPTLYGQFLQENLDSIDLVEIDYFINDKHLIGNFLTNSSNITDIETSKQQNNLLSLAQDLDEIRSLEESQKFVQNTAIDEIFESLHLENDQGYQKFVIGMPISDISGVDSDNLSCGRTESQFADNINGFSTWPFYDGIDKWPSKLDFCQVEVGETQTSTPKPTENLTTSGNDNQKTTQSSEPSMTTQTSKSENATTSIPVSEEAEARPQNWMSKPLVLYFFAGLLVFAAVVVIICWIRSAKD